MPTLAVSLSQNRKTGETGAVYRTQDSCPTSCPFIGNGCYAEGRTFSLPRKHGSDDLAKMFRKLQKQLPLNGALRLNVSGDFFTATGEPDWGYIAACNKLVKARPDLTILAYTHGWRQLDPQIFNFVVNASCETPAQVEEALERGWQTVLVDDGSTIGQVLGGRNVIQCPEETRGVKCVDCRACGAGTRTRPVIVFTPHGTSRKRARATVAAAREVSP